MSRATVHTGASRPASVDAAVRLARLVSRHELPARGTADSTDRMLDAVAAVLTDQASIFDASKVMAWVRRLPLASAAKPEPGWQDRTDKRAIYEAVLMHGILPGIVASNRHITTATVAAIVDEYRTAIQRSK